MNEMGSTQPHCSALWLWRNVRKYNTTWIPSVSTCIYPYPFHPLHPLPCFIALLPFSELHSRTFSLKIEREIEGLGYSVMSGQLLQMLKNWRQKSWRLPFCFQQRWKMVKRGLRRPSGPLRRILFRLNGGNQPSVLICGCSSHWPGVNA